MDPWYNKDREYGYVVFKNYLAFYCLKPGNAVYGDLMIYGNRI